MTAVELIGGRAHALGHGNTGLVARSGEIPADESHSWTAKI